MAAREINGIKGVNNALQNGLQILNLSKLFGIKTDVN